MDNTAKKRERKARRKESKEERGTTGQRQEVKDGKKNKIWRQRRSHRHSFASGLESLKTELKLTVLGLCVCLSVGRAGLEPTHPASALQVLELQPCTIKSECHV